ncbi:hypothetical protein JXA63_00835 [Candidatus Woesebacteria bacterium]|nr:hypothetical protein [Candidatus Woesebacteria bacterium]
MSTKIALLMSTNDWEKMNIYLKHLSKNQRAAWRNNLKYSKRFLESIGYPINLYFFHRNIVKFRANCVGIFQKKDRMWLDGEIPEEYKSSKTEFTTAVYFDKLKRVKDTHISEFPKWDDPSESFERGQQGLLRVVDLLDIEN